MAAPATAYSYGSFPAALVGADEQYLLVKSVNYEAKRTKLERKEISSLAVEGLKYVDPRLTIKVDGQVSDPALLTRHPGTLVTSNVNFNSPILGFDNGVGTTIYEDVNVKGDSSSGETMMDHSMHHHPFVVT